MRARTNILTSDGPSAPQARTAPKSSILRIGIFKYFDSQNPRNVIPDFEWLEMTNGQLLAVVVLITLQVVEVTPFKAFTSVKVFPPSTPPPGQQESNLPRQKRLVPDSKLRARPNEEDENDRGDNPISNFFNALDDFIDDATMRKLGGGAKFYGKRKSGEQVVAICMPSLQFASRYIPSLLNNFPFV